MSTYELGRQPFGLASPAAWLREAGFDVRLRDLSRSRFDPEEVLEAVLVAFFLPMHTATRLALPVIARVHELAPAAHLCAYGLYAPLTAGALRKHGIQTILGAEFEADLLALSQRVAGGELNNTVAGEFEHAGAGDARSVTDTSDATLHLPIARLTFRTPSRAGLPPLDAYAALQLADGSRRVVGYTEASRGCKHRCRHCPVVPIYDGQFRVVPTDVVLADIAAQIEQGAQHITFGDPDFFNGPTHARRLVEALAQSHPGVSYDVTIKVQHLLQHAALLPVLRDTGCAFVISAVESIDDDVLARLEKHHTRADFEEAVRLMRQVGLPLAPTFVAFTPWTSLDDYVALLDAIDRLDLVDAVAPIQLAIRLLLPPGSRLLDLPEVARLAGPLDAATLVHPWRHPDPRVDALQRAVQQIVGGRVHAPRGDVFAAIQTAAADACGRRIARARQRPHPARATVPYLTEPWYC